MYKQTWQQETLRLIKSTAFHFYSDGAVVKEDSTRESAFRLISMPRLLYREENYTCVRCSCKYFLGG